MSESWLTGKVVENRHWTETLFSLRVEGVRLGFRAGQFVRIALDIQGQRVARAFSFVNPPQDPLLEFYGVIVPQGPLSPRLAELERGDSLYVAGNPAGFLVLSEVPQAQTLWLVATGTGIAPFLSILRTEDPWKRFKEVVVVHAVRYARELTYQELIEKSGARYVTFVSREAHATSLGGRIPIALRDGSLEASAGIGIDMHSHFMLCGNPQMLRDTTAALLERGLRKHRRRAPGHITVESFW
jgi:ferredoxin--NADP+ reductase